MAAPRILPWLLLAACSSGESLVEDADRDGVAASEDCDDADPFAYPGARERCNGRDDDCDGVVDSPTPSGTTLWYVDTDGDGFGNPDDPVRSCAAVDGRIPVGEDCDDADAGIHPGRFDRCDGIDVDCDGRVDEDPDQRGYRDEDGDGHGGPDFDIGCLNVDVFAEATDCDDDAPEVFPGAQERCNDIDDDCDGGVDDLDPDGAIDARVWFADVDLDGYGDGTSTTTACVEPTGNISAVDGDCDDQDADTYPGAFEGCAPIDRNCDGVLPDDLAWWDERWPTRIPITVASDLDRSAPLLSTDVDLGADYDPRTLALVVQDCAVGAVRLDAEFTDGVGGIFAGADILPLGDGVGGLHAELDRDVLDGEPLSLALYLGGPIASTPGDAVGAVESLASGTVTASFDPLDGGLLALAVDSLDDVLSGGSVASPPPRGTFGPQSSSGFLAPGIGAAEVVLPGDMIAVVDVVTPFPGVEAADATVEQRIRWVGVSGRPQLYGWVTQTVTEEGAVADTESLALEGGAQWATAVSAHHGDGRVSLSTLDGHVVAGWQIPPGNGGITTAANGEIRLSGAAVALPSIDVAAGTLLVDGALLVVAAGEGPVAEESTLMAPPLEVVVGVPELP